MGGCVFGAVHVKASIADFVTFVYNPLKIGHLEEQTIVKLYEPRLFMGHVDKGFQPGVFVRSEPGFS